MRTRKNRRRGCPAKQEQGKPVVTRDCARLLQNCLIKLSHCTAKAVESGVRNAFRLQSRSGSFRCAHSRNSDSQNSAKKHSFIIEDSIVCYFLLLRCSVTEWIIPTRTSFTLLFSTKQPQFWKIISSIMKLLLF